MSSVEYACLEFGENVEKMLDIQDFVQFCFECTHYYKRACIFGVTSLIVTSLRVTSY